MQEVEQKMADLILKPEVLNLSSSGKATLNDFPFFIDELSPEKKKIFQDNKIEIYFLPYTEYNCPRLKISVLKAHLIPWTTGEQPLPVYRLEAHIQSTLASIFRFLR